ncbi:LPS-assembly protein LptD [Adhaeretor mobilis]|uniref:organic solvent tolerance protein OstA n=1 Tax=Adhaeretor mobilis TaxID=1930276 RepID=UPI0011AA150F|nr:organic solvent tolerance protein OstA [Adhaeretor mobilis]
MTLVVFMLNNWQPAVSQAADILHADVNSNQPITVAADWCSRWQQGVYEVWYLHGHCYLNQGLTYTRGKQAVLWIDRREGPHGPKKVIAYFEPEEGGHVSVDFRRTGDASSDQPGQVIAHEQSPRWFSRLTTSAPLRMELPTAAPEPATKPAIYQRGLDQFDPDRRHQLMLAQFTEFAPTPGIEQGLPLGTRRFQILNRSDVDNTLEWKQLANGQNALVAKNGIRVIIEGLTSNGLPGALGPVGTVDISTDRAVVWAAGVQSGLAGSGVQSSEDPLEIYMEGNIEFRQGDRIVYADRMFYDVRRQVGIILNAELLTPLPRTEKFKYQGLVRLKAAAIRQLDDSHFAATDALVTTSRLEEPAYHFGSQQIMFEDVHQTVVDSRTGQPLIDPLTGTPVVDHKQLAESRGNSLYVRGVPVFYWPTIATDLEEPSFFIDRVRVGDDSVFGTQVMVDFDAYQLFGIRNAPEGTKWGLSTDYLSDRGFGAGTDFQYERPGLFNFDGPAEGRFDLWAIDDNGVDNLGRGRRSIVPEEAFRYRVFGEHRQRLASGWEITGELGLSSDRTFLEQYYEQEWDELKSPRTGLRAKRFNNNREFSIEANAQVNPFWTETQWLPRVDHYWLGESLLGDRLTWFEHSQAGYANMNNATPPSEPTLLAQFSTLPWEAGSGQQGERLATRQEIDLPLQAGVVKFVPYVLGEAAHWGEALDGESIDRLYGQAGVRASIPFWSVDPTIRDTLFNLNGLAHKVVLDAEFAWADSSRNYDELPLYDQLDDTSITEFRRRLFNGTLPPNIDFSDPKFDPRFYAIRSGLQGWVTSPSTEVVEDQTVVRMGARQRWQTKRGGPGREHIVDWLTLDTNASWFPDSDRDNLGQDFGLVDYDLRWHLGDRFTIVSDGAADFFGSGLKTVSAGVLLNRPTRGNGYVGFRSIEGPFSSNVLLGSYSYRIGPKWLTSASASYDISEAGLIGQTLSITRIGESLLVSMGVNIDDSKDNVGVRFLVEPRFLPKKRITQTTGIDIPPAGAFGLE